jgi:hypothetical protein
MFSPVTVSEFLTKTPILKKDIAKQTGVDIATVFRWQAGSTHPEGEPLKRLVKLAAGQIRPQDLPTCRRCGRLPWAQAGGRRA